MTADIGHEPRLEPPDEDYKVPICPECGCECETFYTDFFDNILGCDECIGTVDARAYMPKE